jgi:hypothetical protein
VLDYVLESSAGYPNEGVFYFARRDFNGGSVDDGPNYIDDSRLYLWGNNWLNANGSTDRADFQGQGGVPLGLDLYAEVPEPPVVCCCCWGCLVPVCCADCEHNRFFMVTTFLSHHNS